MNSEKRNAFEKHLQKDPFAEDALDGFLLLDRKKAEKDISIINKKILGQNKTSYNSIYITGIAAAIALLVISSLTYLAINQLSRSKDEKQLGYTEEESLQKEKELIFLAEEDADTGYTQKEITATGSSMERVKKEQPKIIITDQDELIKVQNEKIEEVIEEDYIFYSVESNAGAAPAKPVVAVDIICEEKNESVAIAVLEDADKGSKSSRKTLSPDYKKRPGYIAPLPVKGMESFNKYIEDNAIIPDSIDLVSASVLLRLLISEKGEISNIEVLRSPSPTLSIMAVELIKNGPRWIPAKIDGKSVSEEVILTIDFKK
ncbi:MAG: energy transducer TonB [Bacteroidetes bacterium]|nr:energy transducer TonB [Bacteroidota bacterium]